MISFYNNNKYLVYIRFFLQKKVINFNLKIFKKLKIHLQNVQNKKFISLYMSVIGHNNVKLITYSDFYLLMSCII